MKRPLAELSTEGRPLSQGRGVEALFAQRKEMYERFADVSADSRESLEDAVDAILEVIG